MIHTCQHCKSEFVHGSSKRKFCSRTCYGKSSTGRKIPKEVCEKISASLKGVVFSDERKQRIGKSREKVLSPGEIDRFKDLMEIGMPDGYVCKSLSLSQKVMKRCKNEMYPHGIPWQMKYLESDISPEAVHEVVRLSRQKIRYRRIASMVDLDKKTVKKILTTLSIKDPTIKCYSYDDTCWSIRKESEPEKIFRFILEKRGVEYRSEVQLQTNSKFFFDFHIVGTNDLVEINGDYWHCNPAIYARPINGYQKWAIRRDFAKKDYAKRMGFRTIVFWEHDLKTNPESIDEYVRKKYEL